MNTNTQTVIHDRLASLVQEAYDAGRAEGYHEAHVESYHEGAREALDAVGHPPYVYNPADEEADSCTCPSCLDVPRVEGTLEELERWAPQVDDSIIVLHECVECLVGILEMQQTVLDAIMDEIQTAEEISQGDALYLDTLGQRVTDLYALLGLDLIADSLAEAEFVG